LLPPVLASLVGLIRLSPRIENSWKAFFGASERRKKTIEALEKAAAALEEAFGDVISVEDETQRSDFARVGCLPPSRLVAQTRLYVSLLNMTEAWAEIAELHSLEEFTKYLFVGYIKRATGRFRDRNASALIGEIFELPAYDEVALRMWRSRNYERVDKHVSWIPDLLLDMGNDIRNEAARLT